MAWHSGHRLRLPSDRNGEHLSISVSDSLGILGCHCPFFVGLWKWPCWPEGWL